MPIDLLIYSFYFDAISYRDSRVTKHYFLSIFLNLFLITYVITIAILQCKIYSIVRRHRFQIYSQQVQGSGQTHDEMRTTFQRHKPSARGSFHI